MDNKTTWIKIFEILKIVIGIILMFVGTTIIFMGGLIVALGVLLKSGKKEALEIIELIEEVGDEIF